MNSANQQIVKEQVSNVQPIWKFSFLSIITFGLYQIPWSHKQWKFIKEREKLNIRPWFRSWFLPFYLYSLCQKIFALAEEEGYRRRPSPFLITLIYWSLIILCQLPIPFKLIGLLTFLPLISILRAFNFYWERKQPNLPVRTSFTGREIVWIVFGAILWLPVLGVLLTATGSQSNTY